MNIENNIKLWSNLGMRATFGLIAMELVKKYPDLMITTSDVSTSAGLDRYKNKYPDKFIDVKALQPKNAFFPIVFSQSMVNASDVSFLSMAKLK